MEKELFGVCDHVNEEWVVEVDPTTQKPYVKRRNNFDGKYN